MNTIVMSDITGKFDVESQMFLNNFTYLRTENDIIMFAQLVQDKLEFKGIKITFQNFPFFRMRKFYHLNDAIRLVKRTFAKLRLYFCFQRFELIRGKILAD